MQPLAWYIRRMRQMSADEIGWRAQGAMRDLADHVRVALDLDPPSTTASAARVPQPAVCSLPTGWCAAEAPPGTLDHAWREALVAAASAIAANRLTFFNLADAHLGDPIDWNRDHETGRAAPLRFAASIDYRDVRVTGDAKVVWEPNRHHQFVVLGRAFRATGRIEFAAALVSQLESWLAQCPYGRGMNWRSPLELAVRMINWTWALDLVRPSGLVHERLAERVLRSMHLHLHDIARKYSRGSSANNHRLGEAAGVFVTTTLVPALATDDWREQSRTILVEETRRQTYDDGGTREQALSYQLFVLQFLLAAVHAARCAGDAFPAEFDARVQRMLEFVAALQEAGAATMFGDSDEGYVLDLGGRATPAAVLAMGGALFDRPDLALGPPATWEPAAWLLGPAYGKFMDACQSARAADPPLESGAFRETGCYLLQDGRRRSADAISVWFDAGELGFGPLAAHGHADALSFTLQAFGTEVLADPGTYDYFTDAGWRTYFRSTPAHNTVTVDGLDQSVMLGPFMWGRRAKCRLIEWRPEPAGGKIVAEHDGYTRLADPVVHRRALELDARSRTVTVRDHISMRGEHDVRVVFHLSEGCRRVELSRRRAAFAVEGGSVVFEFDPRLALSVLEGSPEPIGGWISRGYHRKVASCTLAASARLRGPQTLTTSIRLAKA